MPVTRRIARPVVRKIVRAVNQAVAGMFDEASFFLDLLGSTETLDPRITFSRASGATRINSSGVLEWAPHNLLTLSEQFDNAAWTKSAATVTANAAAAPDGTTTADLVTSTGADGYFGRGQSGVSGNQQFTASIYLRADAATTVRLYLLEAVGGSAVQFVTCNVTTEWQRFSVSFTTGAAVTAISTQVGGASSFGTGKAVYAWGYQLNVGALQPYYPTISAPYYGPRFDYDPVTLAPRGLLIEEQRTNLLTYSEQFDNAAWSKTDFSVTANATTAPDGKMTGDKLARATTTATFNAVSQNVSVSSGTAYTLTCYAKAGQYKKFGLREGVTSGAYASFNLLTGTIIESNPGTGTALSASIVGAGGGWFRCSLTITLSGTTFGARVNPLPDSYVSGSTSYSWAGNTSDEMFVWGAQLEAGAKESSYIPTTTAAATRAADIAPCTGTNFSSWYRADEGTLFVEGSIPFVGGSAFPAFASVDDGTSNNAMEWSMWDAAGDSVRFAVWNGGVNQASIVAGTYVAATVLKLAGSYKANDFSASYNGASAVTDTAGTVPVVNLLRLGQNRASGNPLNGHLRRIAFFPRAFSAAELQALTS